MVLGVDVSRLVGPRTGVGRHLEHLIDSWSSADLPFEEVRLHAHTPVDALPPNPRFRFELPEADRAGIGWQLGRLRPRASGADVFFAAYALPPGVRTRCVVLNPGILEGRFCRAGIARAASQASRRVELAHGRVGGCDLGDDER